ncbi:MAG TPA: 5-(carboxyamino)imidazole ribonucleotide synthase [Vicinamibacterales bacterium]|nr:5-(carboxyamino)imidazole ribonucleotide synthase [Vicinamibacterales bacterium]
MILPGSTIGVLGGGQLGRMFAMAARRLGYRVHTLAPDHDTPTGQIADVEINASYDDMDAVRAFAQAVDVVTFEFENVSAEAVAEAERHAIVRPNGRSLAVAQHRLKEKSFLVEHGLPVAPFAAVRNDRDLAAAAGIAGCPSILKTATSGYDGKGQIKVDTPADLGAAWDALGRRDAVLEAFVDLDREISVIGARGVGGEWSHFGPIENAHVRHILDVSVTPASVPDAIAAMAVDAVRRIMEALDFVGILCVEFFIARDGRLLVNELAPRPHNSGHLTFDACRTSQFEQQLRAVCGLPLGSPDMLQPAAAMANLLGDLWEGGEPNWAAALALPDVKLHLYGKSSPRPGRKMGHLTVLAASPGEAQARVLEARDALGGSKGPALHKSTGAALHK